jgi:hypothetical protein
MMIYQFSNILLLFKMAIETDEFVLEKYKEVSKSL